VILHVDAISVLVGCSSCLAQSDSMVQAHCKHSLITSHHLTMSMQTFMDNMIPLVQDFVLVFGNARHAKGDSNQRHACHASHRYDLCSSRQDICLPRACLLCLADAGPEVSHF